LSTVDQFSSKEIEMKESWYLEYLEFYFKSDMTRIKTFLNTKEKIRGDWIEKFDRIDKQSSTSALGRGAERIIEHVFPRVWLPNSSPIGSDLMFETHDAIIHLDVKTSKVGNDADHKGRVALGENQTSYSTSSFTANLPPIYNVKINDKETVQKICLTYALQIIYNKNDKDVMGIVLIAIPNGKLKYGEKCINKGKAKDHSMRFVYKKEPVFKFLDKTKKRYKILSCEDEETKKTIEG